MVNDPRPWQLTVGQLRALLHDVPDGTVVALVVPAGGIGHDQLDTYYNVNAIYRGGAIVHLTIADGAPDEDTAADSGQDAP